MILPTAEVAELYKKFNAATGDEKEELYKRIKELTMEQFKALEGCPLCN